jgi:ubiquinone/menaquinone biosynthesis C-methylase UbiE
VGEDLGFGGEVAGFYHQYLRGYPPAVIDTLTGAFGLTGSDFVIDLGCGTGQLTLPIARRVRAVAGVDPEPDMLARARQAAAEQGVRNASWLLGADTDIPALAALLGSRLAGAVTIGQALHWMRAFADQIRRAVTPHAPFTEPVPVRMLLGRRTQP